MLHVSINTYDQTSEWQYTKRTPFSDLWDTSWRVTPLSLKSPTTTVDFCSFSLSFLSSFLLTTTWFKWMSSLSPILNSFKSRETYLFQLNVILLKEPSISNGMCWNIHFSQKQIKGKIVQKVSRHVSVIVKFVQALSWHPKFL